MNTAGIEVNSPSKYPTISHVQMLKHSGPSSRKTSSGVTLRNIDTQTLTVVTGFAAFMPVIPPPSAPSPGLMVASSRKQITKPCPYGAMTRGDVNKYAVSRNVNYLHCSLNQKSLPRCGVGGDSSSGSSE